MSSRPLPSALPVRIWWTTPPLNTSFGNSGGAGLGAAMGNKKLKGLAIRGTGSVKVADPKKVLELSNYMMGNLIGGNNNHNVPAQPQSWAEYSATSGKNRWSGAPGRMWKKGSRRPRGYRRAALQRHQQDRAALLQGLLRLRRTGCGVHREERRLLLLPHPLLHRV